jgi:predicted amidophosphoribosyltransferase
MKILHAVVSGLAPPLCAACGRPCRHETALCSRCARRLAAAEPLLGGGPAGLDRAWSSAPHEDVARSLVAALKFRHLLPVAELVAERISWLAPAHLLSGTVVPVPTPARRLRQRGFDPAGEIAAALAERIDAPFEPCLFRRDGGRQVGRRRGERLAHAPHVGIEGEAPLSVLLVDDVLTTGATLTACSRALRGAGARRIVAVTFTRRL